MLYFGAIDILKLAAPMKLRPVLFFMISNNYIWRGIVSEISFRWRIHRLGQTNLEHRFLDQSAPWLSFVLRHIGWS